ncbi:MAG: gfo/Idh/MocA family oxidoreductase, partial [Chitinophagia bacterium]|nr:gfo/Idh/MocA family oxidoreductase [Chitinophagia bacterium]
SNPKIIESVIGWNEVNLYRSEEHHGDWLNCMITGWGSHHVDCAHWAMDTEHTGPIEVWANADFPTSGLWNVHGSFTSYGKYENGVLMTISTELPNGIKFVGTEGWIFVTRSNPKIIESVIGWNEVNLYRSEEHHGDWLNCMITREQPIAPAEVGHRSCSTCLIHHMAMRIPRRLHWDPKNERFINDDTANKLLNRPHRFPYTIKGLV